VAYFEKRITRKGEVRWRVQVRRRGADETRTFRTKSRAREWALQVEAGITGEARPLGKHTVLEALRRYAVEVSPAKRGGRWEVVRLKAFEREPLDPFVALPLGHVAENHVAAWRDRRLKQVGSSTVRREMNLLASIFELARREWKWIRANPFRDVRKPPEPPARRRGVKASELAALKARAESSAEREVVAGFELGIETGMRAGEMWGLGPEQIDGAVAHLEMTKNGDSRDVALSPRAGEIISGLLADGRPQLFTISNAVRDVLFRRLRDLAGLPDLHFHDSRSEAAWRLSKKLKIQDLADQFGWRDLNSLLFYYKPSAADRAMQLAADEPRTKRSPRKLPSAVSRARRPRE
jgi:integrase